MVTLPSEYNSNTVDAQTIRLPPIVLPDTIIRGISFFKTAIDPTDHEEFIQFSLDGWEVLNKVPSRVCILDSTGVIHNYYICDLREDKAVKSLLINLVRVEELNSVRLRPVARELSRLLKTTQNGESGGDSPDNLGINIVFEDLSEKRPPPTKTSEVSMENSFRDLFLNKAYADITFKVESQYIKAHKGIIASRSPVLHHMLTSNTTKRVVVLMLCRWDAGVSSSSYRDQGYEFTYIPEQKL